MIVQTELEDLPELFGEDDSTVHEASLAAILELQAKGIDIFYFEGNRSILEKPSGQRFEIRYTGEPKAAYEIIRALDA
ncbi:MAG: hypothetical protein RLZZ156_2658 [Deinococcota bacterium]|jgi:UDP-2,3-diacylglucosamine pyrophosphatase LpxH